MKRNMQTNEIRTNILFECSVVGEASLRTVSRDVLDLMSKYQEQGVVVRLVGISLKKPTSNTAYLTKHTVDIQVDPTLEESDVTIEEETVVDPSDDQSEEETQGMEDESND